MKLIWHNILLKILNRINPNLIWNLYAKKHNKLFNKSQFIFSFDCDTEDDIAVVWDVHSKLQDIGVTPVYAVPGALLKRGEKIYKKILETGAEFINHGGKEHTYFDIDNHRHASCFFYDQLPFDTIKEDIILGHKIIQDILGMNAIGWRTPHFGTFQKSEHFKYLYSILKELNYKFATSSCPLMAYKYGPIYKEQSGIIEVPVTGIFAEPFNILDTWGYFAAPDRIKRSQDYLSSCISLTKFAERQPLLINIYGDPSHIHDQPEFFTAMKELINIATNINYSQLLEITHENLRII